MDRGNVKPRVRLGKNLRPPSRIPLPLLARADEVIE
jgi:hypothetical protein